MGVSHLAQIDQLTRPPILNVIIHLERIMRSTVFPQFFNHWVWDHFWDQLLTAQLRLCVFQYLHCLRVVFLTNHIPAWNTVGTSF